MREPNDYEIGLAEDAINKGMGAVIVDIDLRNAFAITLADYGDTRADEVIQLFATSFRKAAEDGIKTISIAELRNQFPEAPDD